MNDFMGSWQKNYPPYEGPEPYLYFAFADADSKKAWNVMRTLLKRGIRVWYCCGPAGNAQELLRRQERAFDAELTLVYLTDAMTSDQDGKSRIMANQKKNRAILCLDTDGANRYLAMDIRETTPSIPLYQLKKVDDLESALIHSDGFNQKIVGKPVKIKENRLGRMARVFFLLAILLAIGSFLQIHREPVYEDTFVISDPVIREAVRSAIDGGTITEENIQNIQTIRINKLPESWDELVYLSELKQIQMPQSLAMEAEELPIDSYRIILIGGAS